MATRGRKPKPAELRLLEGNPGHRSIPDVPKYGKLTEHPPNELPPLGRNLWRRLTKEWAGEGSIVQSTDREALLVLCDVWAVYCDAMAKVRQFGPLIKSKNNNQDRAAVIVNPAWRVARDAARQLEELWARFGLTPSDRARMNIAPEGGADETEDFLFGGGSRRAAGS
jgi:P27 family predicted phage terminase small subunit